MAEKVYLVGAEDVERAGREIASAAETFARSVERLEALQASNQQFMESWLARFEVTLKNALGGKYDRPEEG